MHLSIHRFIMLIIVLSLSACSTAQKWPVAKPSRIQPTPSNPIATGLALMTSHTDNLDFTHRKYRQFYAGIPLWGADIIIHSHPDNRPYRIQGKIKNIHKGFNTTPSIKKSKVKDIALATFKNRNSWAVDRIYLGLFEHHQQMQLIWFVGVKNGPQRHLLFIHAHTGRLVKRINNTAT